MPFKKTGPDEYTSPSGRKFTRKQVTMYYATEGFKPSLIKGKKSGKKRGKK